MSGQTFNVTANRQTVDGQEPYDTFNDTTFSNDTIDVYSNGNSFATVNIGSGTNNTVFAYMFDAITAGNGANTFYSGSYNSVTNTESGGNDTYAVGDGNNTFGLGNNDTVTAGNGSNTFTVYGNDSKITAGSGNNTITYEGTNVSSTVDLGNGDNTINYNASSGVFNVQVGTGSNQIFIGATNSSSVAFTFTQAAGGAPSDIDLSDTTLASINITVTNPGDVIPTDNLVNSDFVLNVATDGYKIPYAATTVNYLPTNEAIAAPYNMAQHLPYFISDLLFYPAPRWTAGIGVQTTPVTLTYSFMQALPSYASKSDATGFATMGPDVPAGYSPQQLLALNTNHTITLNTIELAAITALANWAAVVNINFVSATDSNSVEIRFGENNQGTSSSAYSYDPLVPVSPYYTNSSYQESGDIYINTADITNGYFNTGNFGASTLAHEIGHAIGMGGESGASDPNDVFPAGLTDEDSTLYTVMSYNDVYPYPNGPQVYDIAVAQYLYGPNPTYVSASNTANAHVWALSSSGGIDNLIMDGTGVLDTITAADTTQAAFIDLRQGHFSYLGASQAPSVLAANQLWIGFGTPVNAAIAGSGTTTIICNDGADTITCGSGADLVVVGGGNDTVNGMANGKSTVEFADPLADYKVSEAGSQITVTEVVTPARGTSQGTDILSNVQTLEFSDQSLSVAAAATVAAQELTTFATQENTLAGRGANGIATDYSAVTSTTLPGTDLGAVTPPAGQEAVIGFESATFVGGHDAVILDGPKSSYAIAVNTGGTATIKDIGVGDTTYGQTVTVSGASYIIFNGDNLSLGATNSAAALTTVPGTTTNVLNYPNDLYFILSPADAQLAQFYSSILPWEPQPALSGFEYWANQLAGGMSLQSIAQSFINTSYFQQTFGSPGTTTAEHQSYVELLYKNILGLTLTASNSGVEYWVGQMDSGALDGAQTLISFTNATTTVATINAMSGATAGAGSGWLINYEATGGYADPGAQIQASTILSEAATSGYYNLSLVDPSSVSNAGVSANGITLTPGLVTAGSTVTSGTIVLSSSFAQADISGSGLTIHDGQGADTITITGANNTLSLGSATTDTLNLAGGTSTSVLGYAPGKGSVLEVSGTVNETSVSLLNGTTTPIQGSSLNFGTASAATAYIVNIGSIGDGSAGAVVTAANAAYTVADVNGNATTGALGEHVIFIGTDSGGDTEIWAFRAPLSAATANGHTVQVPINGADLNANHLVDINEITLIATLIGVPTTNLTAAEFA